MEAIRRPGAWGSQLPFGQAEDAASVFFMVLDGIRRLAVADLDEAALERLAAYGEDLFVERKQAIPKDGIGRTVAAFANSLGGWLLLGVANDGTPVGFNPPGRADPQAYIGQLLTAEVDPLPPYLAAGREVKGIPILVVSVFESADTPHLLRTTGALVVRTTRGTETVTDQGLLLELARRGEEALLRAMSTRIGSDLITRELATPDHPPDMAVGDAGVAIAVRAALVTLAPQFSDWAIRREAAETAVNAAGQLAARAGIAINANEPDPRGRGVVARWRGGHHYPVAGTVAIEPSPSRSSQSRRDPPPARPSAGRVCVRRPSPRGGNRSHHVAARHHPPAELPGRWHCADAPSLLRERANDVARRR